MGAKIDNATLEQWDAEDKSWWNEFVTDHWGDLMKRGAGIHREVESFEKTETGKQAKDTMKKFFTENKNIPKF